MLLGDRVIDYGLNALRSECDQFWLCSQQPVNYAEAVSYRLAVKNAGANNVFGPIQVVDEGGRKIALIPINDGVATADGTAVAWAAVNSEASRLLASGMLNASGGVTVGATFLLPPFFIAYAEMPTSTLAAASFTTSVPIIAVPVCTPSGYVGPVNFSTAGLSVAPPSLAVAVLGPNRLTSTALHVASPLFGVPSVNLSGSIPDQVGWTNVTLSAQAGPFVCEYDIRPASTDLNCPTGLSDGAASAFSSMACIVRLFTTNEFDARNGANYTADATIPYSAGTSYHVRIVGNVSSHTYSAYVTPEGQAEVALAVNYAFRDEQSGVTQLNNFARNLASGVATVSGLTLVASPFIFQAVGITVRAPTLPVMNLNGQIGTIGLTVGVPSLGTPTLGGGGVDSFWTVFTATTPSGEGSTFSGAGTRKIYVASAANGGSDSNPGTLASPKLTVAAGTALLRSGSPDWLLFNKGDTWTNQPFGWIQKHGKSASEPILIGAYGSGARPLFKLEPDASAALEFYGGAQDGNNFAIVGLELYSYRRNPADPGWNQTAANAASGAGIVLYNPVTYFLVEDCKISFFVDNLNIQSVDRFTLRRSVIVDSWAVEPKHAQGGYWDNCLLIEFFENLFDHNGWLAGGTRVIFNHNWYIQYNQRGPVNIRNNITARDCAGGQCRSGGTLVGNISIDCDEMTNWFQQYTAVVTDNVITESGNADMGLGLALRICHSIGTDGAGGGMINANGTYTGNIVTNSSAAMNGTFMFQDAPPNCTVTDNIFYDWNVSAPGWLNSPGANSSLTGNDIDLAGTNNNPGGTAPSEPFPNPGRTVASYAASIGVAPATTVGYLAACRLQSKDNWNPDLAPKAIVNYFRAGFGLTAV